MPPSATAQAVTPFSQAHRRYVAHLYRRALRGALDWYVRRDLWREKAIEIRVQFERNRNVRDPRAVAALLHEAEKQVQRMSHPDPYRPSMFPDGTKWERNMPVSCAPAAEIASLTRFILRQPPMFTQEQKADALKAFKDGH